MVSGPRSTRTAERWAVVVLGVAVTVTLPEPDRRSGLARGLVVNPALAGVDVSICAAQSSSFRRGSSVKVSVAPCGARRVPSSPTPGALPLRGRTVVAEVPAAGQTRVGGPPVGGAFDVGHRLVVDAVVVAHQVVVEPAVQGGHPGGPAEVERVDVAGLGEPDLALDAVVGERVPPLAEVLGADVEVLHPVDGEDAGGDVLRVLDVVAFGPQRGPVAGARGALGEFLLHGGAAQARLGAVDAVGQRVGPGVVQRGALGEVVVVPGGDGGDGHDGLQALDAGGGDAVGDGAVPALADHAGVAVRPAGRDASAAGTGVVGASAAVEPVDHGARGLDVGAAADVHAAVRAVGARQVDQDRRIAARHEEVVVEQRELHGPSGAVVGLLLALVAASAAGVVGAGVHDHGYPAALLRGFARPHDVDGDPVGASVRVAVDPGVHPDRFAYRAVVGVHGSGLTGGCLGGGRRSGECGQQGDGHRRHERFPGDAGEPRARSHGRTVARGNSCA